MDEKWTKAKEQGDKIKEKINAFSRIIKRAAERLAAFYKEVNKNG